VFYLQEGASESGARQRSSGAFPEILRMECDNSHVKELFWDAYEVLK